MALALVQDVSARTASGTTVTTAGITTTTGNLVVVDQGWGAQNWTSITDSGTHSWTNSVAQIVNEANNRKGRQDYNASVTGAEGHTFTLTIASNAVCCIGATEISGHDATPLDKVASSAENTADPHLSDATAETAQAAEFLIGATMGSGTPSANSPWTLLEAQTNFGTEYQIVSATGTYSASFNIGGTADQAMWISTWKEASGSTDFEATGDLDAQSSTLSGAATVGRTSTGALAAQSASIAGAATVGRAASGALAAGSFTLVGAAEAGATRNAGGYEIGRLGTLRTREDIRRDRERFGVIPEAARVIAEVAKAQADQLSLDEQQRLEHLARELELRGIEYESRYLELLNVMRERLIAAEIGRRLRLMQQLEEEAVVMLMLAAAAA